LIGPNGAGKSTLLKTIYGFLKPREGSIFLGNMEITAKSPHLMPFLGLGYIFQSRGTFPHLTVRENLKVATWTFRKDKKKVENAVNEVLNKFPNLKKRENVFAGKLSGGEQRLLEIGRALMLNPKFLLVDEPTGGLAPKVANEIYQILRKISQDIGILMVDQNIKKALEISDYVYVLKEGQIVEHGAAKKIIKKTDSLVRDWLM
jgi:branched-chain amino acid transport system ATP-binding protein